MKKISLLFSLFILFISLASFKINDANDTTLYIESSVKSFSLDYQGEIVSSTNVYIYETNNETKVIILTPTDFRLYLKNDDVILDFKIVSLTAPKLEKIDDYYYVVENGNIVYGDFTFVVDGNEVVDYKVKGEDVSLNYNGKVYTIVNDKTTFNDFIVLIVGLPLLIIVLIYIIYLIMPLNSYKLIYINARNFNKKLNKFKAPYSKVDLLDVRGRLKNIDTVLQRINGSDPLFKEFNTIKTDLNIIHENLVRLYDKFPLADIPNLANYLKEKNNMLIKLTNNGKYKYTQKKVNEEKVKTDEDTLNAIEEDAYHYLQNTNIIKH